MNNHGDDGPPASRFAYVAFVIDLTGLIHHTDAGRQYVTLV